MKKVFYHVTYQKIGEINPENSKKPLLLYVLHGHDTENNMYFIQIKGIRNPLPFKMIYLESRKTFQDISSWLKKNGWVEVGHCDLHDSYDL